LARNWREEPADCRGLHSRIFAVETTVARTLRGSFIAIETTALLGTRDLPDTARPPAAVRRPRRAQKKSRTVILVCA